MLCVKCEQLLPEEEVIAERGMSRRRSGSRGVRLPLPVGRRGRGPVRDRPGPRLVTVAPSVALLSERQ